MKRMNELDDLRNEAWSEVYADVPDSVQAGVQFAFMRIRAREKRRRTALRALACAACLALVIGAAGLMLGREADADYIADNLRKLNTFSDMSKRHWAYYAVMEAANAHTATLGESEIWSK